MTALVVEPTDVHRRCEQLRAQGKRVGLIPTMGALHEGHLSLIEAVRSAGATHTLVSIFVNPLQFAPSEDLEAYPRTLGEDVKRCETLGVDLVYAPDPATMYTPGFQTHVAVEQTTVHLEGRFRPTHFQGVTTVVTKLFNSVGPCCAAFGRKDYQQWRTISRMVTDLNMPVEVIGCPIIREADGLAMSSRNRYLAPQDRQRATAIIRGLRSASEAHGAGERSVAALEALARRPVEQDFDSIDYISLAHPEELTPLEGDLEGPAVLLAAAHLGATRLIDNMVIGE